MISMPRELVALLVILAFLSICLAVLIRGDLRTASGQIDVWGVIESLVGQFFILVMLAAAALQIIVRYFEISDLDLQWTEELGRLALVWGAFWGAAALQRADDHIRMTVLYDLMPSRIQFLFRIIGDVVAIVLLIPLVWFGWQTARNLDIMLTIALGTPLSIFAYPVPVAGALMLIHTVALLVRRIMGREQPLARPQLASEI
jgi:TRAP-type C4-dicarboxylate transport system permease small subunit